MKEKLPIRIKVRCINNKGVGDSFEEGVEYAWLGQLNKVIDEQNKTEKFWEVEDAFGAKMICLPDMFEIVPESTQTGVKVKLIGEDGNIFSIIGRVVEAMRRAGVAKCVQSLYQEQVMNSKSYDEALCVTISYVEDMTYEEKLTKLQEECGVGI